MLAVSGVGLVALCQDACGAQDILGEGACELPGDEEVMEQSLFVFAVRDVDLVELEGFSDGEIDLQRGQEGLCCLIVEVEPFDEFHIAQGSRV